MPQRSEYKETWTALSGTVSSAKIYVSGTEDESEFDRSGAATTRFLMDYVGVSEDDVVLEIGCGVGRVGRHLAPNCRRWIGTDVSPNMVAYTRERLGHLRNVEVLEISGHDLGPIDSGSIDLAYCTVVFTHLSSWDRYAYVEEAFRVVRPGGKLYIDGVNLCSDPGWALFEMLRRIPANERPAHIAECSTPQELQEYLRRAGFEDIRTQPGDELVSVWGLKPLGA